MTDIKYVLPDFLSLSRNSILLNIFEKNRDIVREGVSIYSFYGTFPNAIWNGGSVMTASKNSSLSFMKKIRNFYNKKGIIITFTFTNSLIEEEHLYDEYCNQILEVFHNGMNEVLVVSPILEEYIRKNYPLYKINRSIIASEKNPFLSKNYNLTVLSKFKNRDFEFLNSLSKEDREKTELLCNEYCVNDCKFAYSHYKEYAYIQLHGYKEKKNDKTYATCRHGGEPPVFLYERFKNSKYYISPDDIANIYGPMGFKYFKLGGRGEYNMTSTDNIIEYLIKPNYQQDIRTYIVERMMMDFKKETLRSLENNFEYSKYIEETLSYF